MRSKLLILSVLLLLTGSLTLKSQTSGNSVTEVILSAYTARSFVAKPVADSDIDLILRCGIKAPSARNSQPWRFTVVKDQKIVGSIARNAAAGNILIVVSGLETDQPGTNVDFDCALATQNMVIAAESLGLGTHIYTGPVSQINSSMKETLEIPKGYRAVSVLQIGHVNKTVDAVSSASPRNSLKEVVNYK